ncbi:substrate-binding domain-containing protein [Streptosporangium sp. NPDC051023]|uniref:substrate-binding domain-containing protein n=1 Tax=Streptosporangium sp. NPDC051023 TaxID=3155410 RepID=UPI003450D552
MNGFPWEVLLAVLGIFVPVLAFLWEFGVVGRKRLGYRIQMDTTATDEVPYQHPGVLQRLREQDDRPLVNPSFVLLRIENTGLANIDTGDYAVPDEEKAGIRVEFPGRRIAGMAITELSDDFLAQSFTEEAGLKVEDGVIGLPRVPLNRGQHYKVLVALEDIRQDTQGRREKFDDPKVIGGIKGGIPRRRRGRIYQTESHTGMPWYAVAMVGFLVVIIASQLLVSLNDDRAPLDCAQGKLTLTGSTAFKAVLQEAADQYRRVCPEADFAFETTGSHDGLVKLDAVGRGNPGNSGNWLAFSDGPKEEGEFPQLLPRPIAFVLFTLVVNGEAGVQDLPLKQVRDVFQGKYGSWKQVNGNDLPIRLVDRDGGSGTRNAFEKLVLGTVAPGRNSNDCRTLLPGAPSGVVRCERDNTGAALDAVARTPGAIGYSELGAATERRDLKLARIDGQAATLAGAEHGAYPFGETEYAYTYGEPKADSLAASFLRFLTNEIGRDIVHSHGDRPCAELQNPVRCRPS